MKEELFISILKKNKNLMDVLDYIDSLNMPNYYIASGALFQTIWNYYDNKDLNYGIKDIDVIYYDNSNITVEKDLKYYELIKEYVDKKGYKYGVDVSNEARMHLYRKKKYGIETKPYKSSEDAIKRWLATINCVGIRKENGKYKVYAPYGLDDIFNKIVRPLKKEENAKDIYYEKVKSWQERFDNLKVIDWE